MYQCITERKARGYMCPRVDAEIHCRIPGYTSFSRHSIKVECHTNILYNKSLEFLI